jgi:hypothetical protein
MISKSESCLVVSILQRSEVVRPGLVMRINFRIRIAFAKFFKVIASIDRFFALSHLHRKFAFSHRYFMDIFSGKLYFRTI